MDPKIIDDIAKKLADNVPSGIREMQADLEKNFHATLQTAFNKLNLVTREEFDVQSALLARTRSKLEAMQKQLAELESSLSKKE